MVIDRLIEKIIKTGNPSVVGLDPDLKYIPEYIKTDCFERFGKTLKGAAESYFEFNKSIIDKTYDLIPAVKPQVAMYERLGACGIECFIKTVEYAKEKGLVVIGDVKRGDIASTAAAYSEGHIGRVDIDGEVFEVFKEDFITLNPYLGWDSVEPYIKDCKAYEKGLFILVKTSNPHSGQLQDLITDGAPIYEKVGRLVNEWGSLLMGENGYSSIGAVVGATHPNEAEALRHLMPNIFFLVPGYGAQGGTAEDLSVCFDKNGLGAIVNSSRGIITAHQKKEYAGKFREKDFAEAARAAVIDMRDDLRRNIRL